MGNTPVRRKHTDNTGLISGTVGAGCPRFCESACLHFVEKRTLSRFYGFTKSFSFFLSIESKKDWMLPKIKIIRFWGFLILFLSPLLSGCFGFFCVLWHCAAKCSLIWYNSRHNQFNCLPVRAPWLTSLLWGWWHFRILSDSSLLCAPSSPAGLLITAYVEYIWVFRNSQKAHEGHRDMMHFFSLTFLGEKKKEKEAVCVSPNMFHKKMFKLASYFCIST